VLIKTHLEKFKTNFWELPPPLVGPRVKIKIIRATFENIEIFCCFPQLRFSVT